MSEQREQFRRRVEELVAQFEREVDSNEWVTRRYPKRMRDEDRSVFEVPALYLQKGPVKLLLDPIGYNDADPLATADIYLLPAYDPTVYVLHQEGRWLIYHGSASDVGVPLPPGGDEGRPLTAATINQALDSIADHAVPSV